MKNFISHTIFPLKMVLLLILFGFVCSAQGQTFTNMDFEHLLKEDQVDGWAFNNETTQATLESNSSNNSLKISKSENWRKNFYQDQEISLDQLTVYRLSGKIKVEGVNGRRDRAYLRIQFFGEDSLTLNFANNLSQNINKTQDWNTYEVECIAPLNAVRIRVGGGLWGEGTAWFDDFTVKKYSLDTSSIVMSNEVEEYINSVVEIMKNDALHQKNLDFGSIHQILRYQARGVQEIKDTHPIVNKYAKTLLADGHSQLWSADYLRQLLGVDTLDTEKLKKDILQHIEPHLTDSLKETIDYSEGKLLEGDLAYLTILPFSHLYWEALHLYADSLQKTIAHLDHSNVKGWIIDLRKNWGGTNMPMIAGLGPLLDSENKYYYIRSNGEVFTKSYYKEGVFYDVDESEGNTLTMQLKNFYQVKHKNLPIALLTNEVTGSAGEVVLASFLGQKNVKSFGSTTGGAITANKAVFLDDGALFHISTAYLADRNQKVYYNGITPDIKVEFGGKVGEDLNNDPLIQEAKKWINEKSTAANKP